ncbi:uncharacterized protein BP01DRAFT_354026 [Aspergillus saccharolyticus JOP 1030-1]|uniref:DEUBAD domain-containing protein n=1 Tax=Aspergillus saccharolyticus JOP 1030-1 TaxID=1450539 RepID=A0A318ZNT0_9EURO|nr:hypothetical protein BP01DRAFT_354026 [Aspergillus saccharolyticus JOP 1030-1]PYH48184.1 hypothetical protein BP01DRAFT_354026 [Aspergillus saccharolyticus JOP 1030-1]
MSPRNARPKRNPRRAANKQWSEEHLMTSSKSQLVKLDLVKLLSHPEAWTCLEESEKEEILKLLPDDAHPTPYPSPDDPEAKIPPPPDSFLRYSNNWRDGIRQFQVDLQQGRYEPEWQRQAELASKERAAGKFDRFKEEEFEEFWGQKQKMDRSSMAGQSSQVKLKTLTDNGVIRQGDILKYSRAFSTGSQKVLVEKEARIVNIEGPNLTFAVPPGQRTFLTSAPASAISSTSPAGGASSAADAEATDANSQHEHDGVDPGTGSKAEGTGVGSRLKRKPNAELSDSKRQCSESQPNGATGHLDLTITENETSATQSPPGIKSKCSESQTSTAIGHPHSETEENQTSTEKPLPEANSNQSYSTTASSADDVKEIVLPNIQGLNALASKIIEIDGRVKKVPNGNSWKEFRAYRHNQDMGSLWEIRQSWFMRENKSGRNT